MRRTRTETASELEELRRLLLSRDREKLRELHLQVTDKERRSHDVAAILPEAVKLSRERGEELARALRPAVEGSVRESIEKHPETFVDALHPIIGPIVRRSIAESLRRLLQSLNQSLEHTFSWRGLKWRFEALRTGKSFADVVMLRSLLYRVEQVFLIHRETSLSLLHVSADPSMSKDSDMVAGMLSAIQDFARDSFSVGDDSSLEEFRIGELQVWIAPGRYAYLAAVIRGNPARDLRAVLEETIEGIHVLKGSALASFDGDASKFEDLRPELESCLRSQASDAKQARRPVRAWLMLVLLAAILAAAFIVQMRVRARWLAFVRQLSAQPGVVVTEAHRHWFRASEIAGLRDAAAPDPQEIARQSGINPARVEFSWKDYLALDDASVQHRVEQRFVPPEGIRMTMKDGTLALNGVAPYEWLQHIRGEATLVSGVRAIDDSAVKVTYDPGLATKRFEEQLGLPEGAFAVVANETLSLTGEASHRWLAKIRQEAPKLPGITKVDETAIVDLDRRAFNQSKSVIESAFIYFLVNKDNIASEGFAALSRLPEELRRAQASAKRLGLDIILQIQGSADGVGDAAKNLDLSRRRADKVRNFLLTCGFPNNMLESIAKGEGDAVEPEPGTPAAADEAERRVEFKVIPKPIPGP